MTSLTERQQGDLTGAELGLVEQLRATIPDLMRRRHVPGLNLAVARRGQVRWEGAFGWADLASRRPMQPDTVFRSGSMGKTYTATAVMQLVEQGHLDVDDDVSSLVGFEVVNPLGERAITVHDLLTHRSGLATDGASSTFGDTPPLEQHLRSDIAEGRNDFFRGAIPKWTAPAGAAVQYSNTGIALLGLIVQRLNPQGLSFGTYVQRHVIEPLGMTSTRFPDGDPFDADVVPPELQERVSTGYAGFGSVNVPTPTIRFRNWPAGLVLSTPGEHVRVLLAYLNGGSLDGQQVLRPETVEQMLTPVAEVPREAVSAVPPAQVGLVWMRGNLGERTEWFGHAGSHMWGWDNFYVAFPALDLAIAVAMNRWDVASLLSGTAVPSLVVQVPMIAAASFMRLVDEVGDGARSWAWKRAYAVGFAFASTMRFWQGIDEPITADVVRAIGEGAVDLDPDGLRRGVEDLQRCELTFDGIEKFLASDDCPLTGTELHAAWNDVGGTGTYPVPVSEALRAAVRGDAD